MPRSSSYAPVALLARAAELRFAVVYKSRGNAVEMEAAVRWVKGAVENSVDKPIPLVVVPFRRGGRKKDMRGRWRLLVGPFRQRPSGRAWFAGERPRAAQSVQTSRTSQNRFRSQEFPNRPSTADRTGPGVYSAGVGQNCQYGRRFHQPDRTADGAAGDGGSFRWRRTEGTRPPCPPGGVAGGLRFLAAPDHSRPHRRPLG